MQQTDRWSAASTIDNYSTSPVSEDHPPRPTHPGSRQRLGPVKLPHSPTGRPEVCGLRSARRRRAGPPPASVHSRTLLTTAGAPGTLSRSQSGRQPSFLPVTAAAAAAIEGCQCQWRDMEGWGGRPGGILRTSRFASANSEQSSYVVRSVTLISTLQDYHASCTTIVRKLGLGWARRPGCQRSIYSGTTTSTTRAFRVHTGAAELLSF